MPTDLNFKIKKLDNIKFDYNELLDYYNKINSNFSHLCWRPSKKTNTLDHSVNKIYSWAIQSNYIDPNIPCPPYHIDTDSELVDPENKFSNPTELIFGFGKKIVDTFPGIRQTSIAGHPPGTRINLHPDNDEFLKIHIPILTNQSAWFFFEDEKFNLEIGSAYLINTTLPHGTSNEGDTDRVHLIFKFPTHLIDEIINNDWILDAKLFEFGILELDNIEYSYSELLEYYKEVESNFSDRKWWSTYETFLPSYVPKEPVYGYAILTHLKDPNSRICPPTNTKNFPKEDIYPFATNPTPLMFGFAKKLYDAFPYMEEMVTSGHQPGGKLGFHRDEETSFRIHFPIETENCNFIVDYKNYKLLHGKAYLVNTSKDHGTENFGTRDRIHLFFKIPIGRINYMLNRKYKI